MDSPNGRTKFAQLLTQNVCELSGHISRSNIVYTRHCSRKCIARLGHACIYTARVFTRCDVYFSVPYSLFITQCQHAFRKGE